MHFITNRCNARCSFCFIDFDNENTFKGELSLEEISKLTKSYPKSLLNVNLTGGEPFVRKDIQEIAKLYIENTSIQSIYITTNASLPERIEKFANNIYKKYPHIEQTFQISIDDFPEKHNSVRKIKDLFDNCLKSFKVLKNLPEKINPVVSITVTHENCDNIESIYDFFVDECGIDSIKCTIVHDEGVFETPKIKKQQILDAYSKLTQKINNDIKKGKIKNYNSKIMVIFLGSSFFIFLTILDVGKYVKFKLISEVIFFIIIANLIYAIAGFFTLFGLRSKVERILYRRSR